MDKDTILNYVTETPGNTNRAVLGSMLDSIDSGSSGSESNIIVINVESVMNAQTQVITVYSCDMTAQEVFNIISAGKAVIANIHMDVQVNDATVQDNYISIMLDQYDVTHSTVTGSRLSLEQNTNYIEVTRLIYTANSDLPSITTYNKTL